MIRSLVAILLAGTVVVAPSPALAGQAVQQSGQDAAAYRQPPAPIATILDAAPTPTTTLSPDRRTIAILGRANLPPIATLAAPMLQLAGYRIDPRTNGPAESRVAWLNALSLQDLATGAIREVALPQGTRFTAATFSPDGRRLALIADGGDALRLWFVDVERGTARAVSRVAVNMATGASYSWLPDSSGVMVRAVPAGRGSAPAADATPTGPIIEETRGRTAPVRTYQDLLRNRADEALFTHYFTSQPTIVPLSGAPRAVGTAGVFLGLQVSPDGRWLLSNRVKQPYSYAVPAALFPTEITVSDMQGRIVRRVADLPLRDDVPIAFDAVAVGPRRAEWRADAPATLIWVEAQDDGDPQRQATVRDRLFALPAPFTAQPTRLLDMNERYTGIDWGRPNLALATSRWFRTRNETVHVLDPATGQSRVLASRNYQDRYNDPGYPVLENNAAGQPVMRFDAQGRVLMTGPGATPAGEFPFIAALDIATGRSERLWTSADSDYETLVGFVEPTGTRAVTRRETRIDPPNLRLRDLAGGEVRTVTRFADPAPQLAEVTRRLITYKRADGVQLSGTLYLPAGYDAQRDGPLPLLMWAYPAEFTDPAVAGQTVDVQNRFVRPGGSSHLFLLTQGYAILDNPSMPVIGRDGAEPNDTHITQLVANAQAAVDAVVALGVARADRIAIGGHSYGAFMTANLLAHSDLFRTGIARSGAYNRTLTPFGFQAEQRSYWQARDVYTEMSPFTHVDKVNEPLLLIHGEADENSGTFPIQTERFYAALKGLGKTARYVVLPLEGHGYRARESVGHALWEMTSWLDVHLKGDGAPPTAPAVVAARD